MLARIFSRRRPTGRQDAGANALDYVALTVVSAAVLVTAAQIAYPEALSSGLQSATCTILQQENCETAQPLAGDSGSGAGDDETEAGNDDRRDAGRDTRNERTRPGDDDESQPGTDGTPGGEPYDGGLGEPADGESVDDPEPPAWTSPDEGAGEHGSDEPSFWDKAGMQAERLAIESAANAASVSWPNASRNLLHFFGNSGEPLEQDVDQLLDDVPEFEDVTEEDQEQLGIEAVERAQRSGATGPVTFPVNTAWSGFGYDENGATVYDNSDWFYAMGGWSYNQTGEVTVYPPSEPGGEWRYEVDTRVNIRDDYNWDGDKGVTIGPLDVSDEELAEYHRAGWAQEFLMTGESDSRTKEGTVP